MKSLLLAMLMLISGAGDHVLTSLWKQYDEASKADLPKTEAKILEQIKKESMEKHLPVDFWDASQLYLNAIGRVNWKQRNQAEANMGKEVAEFNEPTVTFLWMCEDWKDKDTLAFYLEGHPLKTNIPGLHRGLDSELNGILPSIMESDMEWALWRLMVKCKYDEGSYAHTFAVESLQTLSKGRYPQEATLRYYLLGRRHISESDTQKYVEELKAFKKDYEGKAIALFAEGDLLTIERRDLDEANAGSAAYTALYEKCLDFEKRRKAFSGEEKIIAQSYTEVKNLIGILTIKTLDLKAEKNTFSVIFRNLDQASVKMYDDNDKVVAQWNAQNTVRSFFVPDTLTFDIPTLKDGHYKIKAENKDRESEIAYNQYTLSISTRTDAQGVKVFVADYMSGKPIEKVQLLLYNGEKEIASANVKLNGYTPLPDAVAKQLSLKKHLSLVAVSGDRRSKSVNINQKVNTYTPDTSTHCNIYRDRGAYTPGDTLQFKAVVYKGDPMLKMQVRKGHKFDVLLRDSEGNVLETLHLKTNEYGSASGSFAIPRGLRNGYFSLEATDGSKKGWHAYDDFRVDEFVLPTFDVTFDKRTEHYKPGATVPVSGKVISYSGHGLSGAHARISVDRWGDKVYESEIPLAADGLFHFDVKASESGHYNAEITIVDSTGETLSFKDYFSVSDNVILNYSVVNEEDALLSFFNKDYTWRRGRHVVMSDHIAIKFTTKDSSYNPVQVSVDYKLYGEDGSVVSKGKAAADETVSLKTAKSGLYTLKANVGDEDSEALILVLLPGAQKLEVPSSRVFVAGKSEVEKKIEAIVGCADSPLWANVTVFGNKSEILETKLARIPAGELYNIEYEYKDAWPEAVRLEVFYFMNAQAIRYDHVYRRSVTKSEMPLEFTSYREKTYPGTKYTFTLKTEAGVEALAGIWDKSMDAISTNNWNLVRMDKSRIPSIYSHSESGEVGQEFMPFYSFSYGAPQRMTKSARVLTASNMAEVASEESMMMDSAPAGGESEAAEVKIRSEFLSALTFQPHLLSGKDGNISFSFSTSDKLSTYYVRVYAHDKSMKNAIAQKEILVSIPVKVAFQEPRFLYEGDLWNAAVTVSSIADEPVRGTLSLEWNGGKAELPVEVPAGQTVTSILPVSIASAVGDQEFTAVFRGNQFSDAVRVTIPVYPAKQTLTEAHSAVLHAGSDRDALINELRSRFVNVSGSEAQLKEITVLDMVKDAIPSHVEPSSDDVLALSEAWYVRLMASKLSMNVEASEEDLLPKILACRNDDGGFAWFEGMKSSPIITAVVLERMAALRDREFEIPDMTTSVKYLDRNQMSPAIPFWCGYLSQAQYMLVRSMYAAVPFTEKAVSKDDKKRMKEYTKAAKSYLTPSAKEGRGLQGQILAKARRLLTLTNLMESDGGLALAKAWGVTLPKTRIGKSIKADKASLLEYAVEHKDGGWYYPNAVMPWRGLLESEAYAHALLSRLLKEYPVADGIRLWLMLQKETQKWDAEPAFIDAITAILDGSEKVLDTKVIALSAQFTKPFSEIKATGNGFKIERKVFLGEKEILPGDVLKVGDKIKVVYKIWNGENRSFVKLTAPREASLTPVKQLSGHVGHGFIVPFRTGIVWGFNPQGFRNVKAACTEYYFDSYPEEDTQLSEEFFVTRAGEFQAPSVHIESLYAPHYRALTGSLHPLESSR